MPPVTRLHLIRHCDVENPQGILYGHLPGFGLSRKGVAQAHAIGRYLRDRPIRRLYVSPLQRAQETASIVASYLDEPSVVTTEDLVEARFGWYLQGIRPAQVPLRRPLWFIHMVWPGLLPNDESVAAMAARVNRPLRRLLEDFPGEGGACISHGDPIQAFWIKAQGRPPWALHRLQCAKGGLLELDYLGSRLDRISYVPPERHGIPVSPAPEPDASHA